MGQQAFKEICKKDDIHALLDIPYEQLLKLDITEGYYLTTRYDSIKCLEYLANRGIIPPVDVLDRACMSGSMKVATHLLSIGCKLFNLSPDILERIVRHPEIARLLTKHQLCDINDVGTVYTVKDESLQGFFIENTCIETFPCHHYITFEDKDGTFDRRVVSLPDINDLLKTHQLTIPSHFEL